MTGARLRLLLHPLPVALLAMLLLSVAELAIADRKFGVFSGGFGQSSTVDRPSELVTFFAGYAAAQLLAALIAWKLAELLARGRAGWTAIVNFAFLYLGLGLFSLTVQYQLHSYFSDAVSFALLKDLGGGSLTDALLFGKSEIAMGLAALAVFLLAWWLALRLTRGFPGLPQPMASAALRWRWIGTAAVLVLLAIFLAPRLSEDGERGLARTLSWRWSAGLINLATDFDHDGYGLAGLRRDSHPFDGARHPLALDRPGNGIDEDGYGGDLELVGIPQPRLTAGTLATRPHVIVVILESTRADVLGKRIDGRPVAPNLEAIARAGGSIVPVYSHVAFTTASLKSIFAGQLVPSAGDPSLFRELKANGYRIGVISGQPEDFGDISATVAMRENADVFVDAEDLKDERAFSFAAQGSLLIDESILLREFDRRFGRADEWDRPTFLYVNFQSPHFPYDHDGVPHLFADPPLERAEISAQNRAEVERTYWNAVAHADDALGDLVARLKRLGVWKNTLLLVSGDHGEALFENGFLGHGHVINDTQYATFLVANRDLGELRAPISISDYRAVLLDLLNGERPRQPGERPFMHIGPIEAPAAIGLADAGFGVVSLRLDSGETCFTTPAACASYTSLAGAQKQAADRVVARWGSERWAAHERAAAKLAIRSR